MSVSKRCGCIDPQTRKQLGAKCPRLQQRRHGTYMFSIYIATSTNPRQRYKRMGYPTQTKASEAEDHVRDLIKLAKDDQKLKQRIGDLIYSRKQGDELPDVDEVRRRLGAGADVQASGATVGEWLESWFAEKRARKASTRKSYRQHLDHYLIPLLGDIARDRLGVEHINGMFDTIEEWNAEILAAAEEDRAPY